MGQRTCSSTSDSKRSDSCDTDKNIDPLKSESDDNMEQKNIIITQPSVVSVDQEDMRIREDMGEGLGEIEEEDEGRKESVSSGSLLEGRTERNKMLSASDCDGGKKLLS